MDARDFAYLGNALIERLKRSEFLHGQGEAECRSVISRVYYAAFLVAHDLLVKYFGFWITGTGQCHAAVQYGLNNSEDGDLKDAYQSICTLYSERRAADYELQNPRSEDVEQAEDMVRLAWEAIAKLDGCRRACASDAARRNRICNNIDSWVRTAQKQSVIHKR